MPNKAQPWQLAVTEAAALIRSGGLSPVELVESCLARIEALDPKIQAWALVDRDGALAEARRREMRLRQGARPGPLHGVPIGVKDIFFTSGLRTEAGSRIMAGFVPEHDATAVVRLKAAGAIVLGKTHTTEFALFDPAPTRNPWDLACTPGGSSSGSAAAVAAGMCPAALGSQTAGSTLRPAAYCGIVGLKPRHGRISTHGVVPLAWTLDHVGILARSVADAALLLQILAGHDPQDPYSQNEPAPDYLAALDRWRTPPRLGLVRGSFFDKATDEVRRHTEQVAARLARDGAFVEEAPLPPTFGSAHETLRTILLAECAAYHRERFAERQDDYGPRIRSTIERGLALSATDYALALQRRLALQREMAHPDSSGYPAAPYDALLTPATPAPAPRDLTTTGDPFMQSPWSLLGFPAISLPTGLSADGLPLAIQLVGAPDDEPRLLWTARWCEQVLDFRFRPPLT